MKLQTKIGVLAAVLALAALPGTAMAETTYTPDPEVKPAPPPHAKAHGKRCQGKSKKHVEGEKGTEFSRCVKALAKAAKNSKMKPKKACKGLSKKHVKGEKGTEFSRCVKAVAQLRREERRAERRAAREAAAQTSGKPAGIPPHGKGANGNGPDYTPAPPQPPGPKAGLPEKAKAYGRYCQGKSKKHVKGERGTEFSRCVTAMAKAGSNPEMKPKKACKGLSKKHVKGEKGTEFSRCVKAAAQLRKHRNQAESV